MDDENNRRHYDVNEQGIWHLFGRLDFDGLPSLSMWKKLVLDGSMGSAIRLTVPFEEVCGTAHSQLEFVV